MTEDGVSTERIARGPGTQERIDHGAAVHELNRQSEPGREQADVPDRGVTAPEQSRVPGWLQTAAAWSWRLLLLAIVIYLIARLLGILYIVVVPCIVALLLPALLTERGLAGRDAAFATELTYGTLRGRGTYDAIVAACSDRDELDPPVRDVLRLGAHQLLAASA